MKRTIWSDLAVLIAGIFLGFVSSNVLATVSHGMNLASQDSGLQPIWGVVVILVVAVAYLWLAGNNAEKRLDVVERSSKRLLDNVARINDLTLPDVKRATQQQISQVQEWMENQLEQMRTDNSDALDRLLNSLDQFVIDKHLATTDDVENSVRAVTARTGDVEEQVQTHREALEELGVEFKAPEVEAPPPPPRRKSFVIRAAERVAETIASATR